MTIQTVLFCSPLLTGPFDIRLRMVLDDTIQQLVHDRWSYEGRQIRQRLEAAVRLCWIIFVLIVRYISVQWFSTGP